VGRQSQITASIAGTSLMEPFGYAISGVTVSPSTIHGIGSSATATVTLTGPAPAGGMAIGLVADVVSVPTSVTVPSGATSATFTATATTIGSGTVLAQLNGFNGAAAITVAP
jgi:hypothetical protein